MSVNRIDRVCWTVADRPGRSPGRVVAGEGALVESGCPLLQWLHLALRAAWSSSARVRIDGVNWARPIFEPADLLAFRRITHEAGHTMASPGWSRESRARYLRAGRYQVLDVTRVIRHRGRRAVPDPGEIARVLVCMT
jgi:hypothetical protein